MDIVIILASIVAFCSVSGLLWYFFIFSKRSISSSELRGLMTPVGTQKLNPKAQRKQDLRDMDTNYSNKANNIDDLKQRTEALKRRSKKRSISLEEKYYHAGLFSAEDRKRFKNNRIIIGILCPILFLIIGFVYTKVPSNLLIVAIFGVLVGLQIPFSLLDRKIAARNEDILFYLPLVVEQISIGVSSSLDIGPCLDKVVSMADERDSHNVVTELVKQASFYVKSGVSLTEALTEIGRLSGHNELKHVFTSLSQVAKHGGEITRQLQELADAVSSLRETKIEEKIKKLELEATGPVALVFVGFMAILLVGFGLQIQGAF